MLRAILKVPGFFLFRRLGAPKRLPFNLTLSLSFRCNSRCKTCNIYHKRSEELTKEEWGNFFRILGPGVFWVTISGGEPFLRKDLPDIVKSLYDHCKPAVINIPTNGILNDVIPEVVKQLADYCKNSKVVINVSVDEIGERHDAIRGAPGCYEKALSTFQALKSLPNNNLSVGIHTVISRFNIDRIPQIYQQLSDLLPDSYIAEIAEERAELNTFGTGISPEYHEYSEAADFLLGRLKNKKFSKIGKLTRALRMEYYQLTKRVLRNKRQIIPCYSGFASAHIAPNGDVWFCCIKAESVGNLKDRGFDLKKIWFSDKANILRERIKAGECFCPLANASYTNMIHDLRSLTRIVHNLTRIS